MRIIADRKDYYDCIQSCAQDRTKIYVRHEEEIHWERNEWPFPSVSLRLSMLSGIYIIGFCGKIYPMIQMSGESDRYGNDPPSVCCYSMKELNEFLKSSLKPNEWEYYLGTQKRTRNRYWQSWGGLGKHRNFANFFENCKRDQDKYYEMFMEKRCPVFVATSEQWGSTITWNALLHPVGFMRIFDPYTAFQEVEMFINNLAVPQNPMPVLSDELKVQKRGFTDQSFRAPFRDINRIPK